MVHIRCVLRVYELPYQLECGFCYSEQFSTMNIQPLLNCISGVRAFLLGCGFQQFSCSEWIDKQWPIGTLHPVRVTTNDLLQRHVTEACGMLLQIPVVCVHVQTHISVYQCSNVSTGTGSSLYNLQSNMVEPLHPGHLGQGQGEGLGSLLMDFINHYFMCDQWIRW